MIIQLDPDNFDWNLINIFLNQNQDTIANAISIHAVWVL